MKKYNYIRHFLLVAISIIASSPTINAQVKNIAFGKVVVAQKMDAGKPENAVDGDPATKWQSAEAFSQWIYVDLAATYNISKIRVLFESEEVAGWAQNYFVQVSEDAKSWTTVDSIKFNKKADTEIAKLPSSAKGRYIRLLLAGRAGAAGGKCYIIKEWEIYGEEAK